MQPKSVAVEQKTDFKDGFQRLSRSICGERQGTIPREWKSMDRSDRRGVEEIVVTVQDSEGGILYGELVRVIGEGGIVVVECETNLDGKVHFDLEYGEYVISALGEDRRMCVSASEMRRQVSFIHRS